MQFIIYVKKSFPHSHQTKYSINQLLSPNDQAVEARYLEQNEDCKELIAMDEHIVYCNALEIIFFSKVLDTGAWAI